MDTRTQFLEALADWRAAIDAFNGADAECLDYAIYRLQAAEVKLGWALHQARKAGHAGEDAPGRQPGGSRRSSRESQAPGG